MQVSPWSGQHNSKYKPRRFYSMVDLNCIYVLIACLYGGIINICAKSWRGGYYD